MNKKCGIWMGAMLFMAAFSVRSVQAQTCAIPPSCEDLGYTQTVGDCSDTATLLKCPLDQEKVLCVEKLAFNGSDPCAQMGFNKTEGDCSGKESLHCPYDESKVFCPAAAGSTGSKIAEIGDIVYTDAISAEPISGRVPVGIVYDVSGKMVSIAEYKEKDGGTACDSHVADGIKEWKRAKTEDMGSIKAYLDKINATIAKISKEAPKIANSSDYHSNCYRTSDGSRAVCMSSKLPLSANSGECQHCNNSFQEFPLTRCVRSFGPNGANQTPDTGTVYAIGDAYKDADGTIIGTVVAVDSSGQHGTIAKIGGSGIANDGAVACAQKTDGGKSWTLATGENACIILQSAGSVEDNQCSRLQDITCGVHASNGQGACYLSGKWCNSSVSAYIASCKITDSLNYVCQASF